MDWKLLITLAVIVITAAINLAVNFGIFKTRQDNIAENLNDGFKRINGELQENRKWHDSHIKDWHKK